ncbi:MAG: PD-(D/E)XK nuclease family protein [Bacteroidales bacterium]
MENGFLNQVAKFFCKEEGSRIKDICFVFPNRRSSLFFQKYIGLYSEKPVLSPVLYTINDLFYDLSGLKFVDKIESLYVLYTHYIRLSGSSESFDEFVFWGDVLLNDFDDVDKYMADAKMLFANVKDIKDLDSGYDFLSVGQISAIRQFWGNFLPYDSENKKKKIFKETWDILYNLYVDFRADLTSKGVAYEGMIYRYVAETVQSCEDSDSRKVLFSKLKKYSKIVFVGQNALNKCEKVLLGAIRDLFDGDFYWDYYGDMVTDPTNKSSLFMSENVDIFPSKYKIEASPITDRQTFELISVPSAVGQTKKVAELLKNLPEESTAVILPDENLLFPLLNSIPVSDDKDVSHGIRNINVTMGYSLSSSNVSTFMNIIEALQKNKRMRYEQLSFYYRDVIALLNHPFFLGTYKSSGQLLKNKIKKENVIFPDEKYLKYESNNGKCLERGELFNLIFKGIFDVDDIPDYQINILQYIQGSIGPVEKEFIYHYFKAINRLRNLHIPMKAETYYRLLSQIVNVISIPFKGEPLSGLQIMGPLETRALDFENIVILSMNEGVFPSKSISSSFIPYNLRKGFNLPNYEFQDSISAYHFYRSIYRAKRVIMICDSRTEGMQSGEVSRYVKQLKYHYCVPLKESITTFALKTADVSKSIMVEKSCEIMQQMEELFFNGKGVFSASSINDYLDCPLRFYYKNVLKIKEEEEVVEEVESGLFGTIFHGVMEDIYRKYIGYIVSKAELEHEIKGVDNIEKLVEHRFKTDGNISEITGKNLITKQLIIKFVLRTLETDMGMAPFNYKGSEVDINMTFPIFEGKHIVKLFGKIDRVDIISENILRLVDYKTGSVNKKGSFKKVEEVFNIENDARPYISLQLLFYVVLAQSDVNLSVYNNISSCIYPLREIFKETPSENIYNEEEISLFKSLLKKTIEEIFNPEIPFIARGGEKKCEYCNLKQLCNK